VFSFKFQEHILEKKETRGMDPEEERYMRIAQERMQKQRDRQRQEAQKRLEAQEKAQKEEERKRQGCDWSSVVLLYLYFIYLSFSSSFERLFFVRATLLLGLFKLEQEKKERETAEKAKKVAEAKCQAARKAAEASAAAEASVIAVCSHVRLVLAMCSAQAASVMASKAAACALELVEHANQSCEEAKQRMEQEIRRVKEEEEALKAMRIEVLNGFLFQFKYKVKTCLGRRNSTSSERRDAGTSNGREMDGPCEGLLYVC
jgi:hypothetical protein